MIKQADASPTKGFFIHMITRDIDLDECVLDLLDNSVDGAGKALTSHGKSTNEDNAYNGFHVDIHLDREQFQINDNCGGISISDAIDYAFRFGRSDDAPQTEDFSIGLYGIGMKRAMFKIGKLISIYSSTAHEGFSTSINVPKWQEDPLWEFALEDADIADDPGTQITISSLNSGIGDAFADAVFHHDLRQVIARDYSVFLAKGLTIRLNNTSISPFEFKIRESADFRPARLKYTDSEGVDVEIIAGMAGLPPDDVSSDHPLPETAYYGWFVICNDRVILPSDKTKHTVWGVDNFQVWHPQYNGFIGIVSFSARDPKALPWTTTKRDIDQSSQVYRRAVARMKEATLPWIEYTTARKQDLDRAKALERSAEARSVRTLSFQPRIQLPTIAATPRVRVGNINYQKPLREIRDAARALGNANMPESPSGKFGMKLKGLRGGGRGAE